ncbi:MAG: exodeoxyribonuclease VII large subunit [Bacteroidota bacterium]|jgi:exodeoxyribonuclease VII large subunit|nr:MAG: exodeoxyribonuclease VII large subunit [Bacteroidota bacterium]
MQDNHDISERKIFSLSQVTRSIQRTLADRYGSSFWVKAEMIKLHLYPHSGHCYPELVEKRDGRLVAQMKATLWRDEFVKINKKFMEVVGEPLKDGIMVLFCARITFDSVHGLALSILDIDPVFSLGELEREKQECIKRLREEQIFDRNRQLKFPLLPQRVAVISVETSKGYADFVKVIENNSRGYRFVHRLFPSLLQGDRAVESIRYQLRNIRRVSQHFDIVAIIRGGGGDTGLSCFNDYMLAREIALFPLPIITGIGHATNETVVEMVAHHNAITPTDLANILLQRVHDFAVPLEHAEAVIREHVRQLLREEQRHFSDVVKRFRVLSTNMLNYTAASLERCATDLIRFSRLPIIKGRERQQTFIRVLSRSTLLLCTKQSQILADYAEAIRKDAFTRIREAALRTDHLERTVAALDPVNVLKRGFSITRRDGKALQSGTDVREGDILHTQLYEGIIESEVKSIKKNSES